jgi:trimeric autotransporter adhesin
VPSWNYRSEEASVRHVGPIAQDFYRAFGLGGTDEAISTVDLAGINLLAVQALERRTAELRQKTDRIERLEAEVIELHAARAELERRLARLEGAPAAPPPATSGGAGTMFNPQPEPPRNEACLRLTLESVAPISSGRCER